MSERDDASVIPMCDGCGEKPAVCTHKAGHSVSFVGGDGDAHDDPEADCFLCDDCCVHSGEEGPCWSLRDLAEIRAERDAILRWSIRHAGYIGTTDGESAPKGHKWWARGDRGRVTAPTAEQAVRLAAGLATPSEPHQ
jgi:hypothetical protein